MLTPSPEPTNNISEHIQDLTEAQLEWVLRIITQFKKEHKFLSNNPSSLFSQEWVEHFGNVLRVHHAMSEAPFTKEKFEYAFIFSTRKIGHQADKASSNTNRGHDITIDGVPCSLKTQADSNIKEDSIHISKFMELGKGLSVLTNLRDHYFDHMKSYEKIFTLRTLINQKESKKYELVEIPKDLLLEAKDGIFETMEKSKQDPKPGYCRITDKNGGWKYELYFDGGSERKLQIKNIKKSYCKVCATWEFQVEPLFD